MEKKSLAGAIKSAEILFSRSRWSRTWEKQQTTHFIIDMKIGFRVFDAVPRIRHLPLEFVPIFFQFANWILHKRLDLAVAVAYILGRVDEYINALIQ